MQYEPSLIEVSLLKRYKRFLADVYCKTLPDGVKGFTSLEIPKDQLAFTVHCANPGRMQDLVQSGRRAWIYDSGNPKRKLRYSLELVESQTGALVCINTGRANRLVAEAIQQGIIPFLNSLTMKAEISWKEGKYPARFDFAFWQANQSLQEKPLAYLEVKSVTYEPDPINKPGQVAFPDAVTARGLKHLRALIEVVEQGYRGLLCFCVNHNNGTEVSIAEHIDPAYAQELCRAIQTGVEVFAIKSVAEPKENKACTLLPFIF